MPYISWRNCSFCNRNIIKENFDYFWVYQTEKGIKYLLYIDILGFQDLSNSHPEKVELLFEAIDKLNVHRHDGFKTIVFSDTILVFNIDEPVSDYHHEYIVMFACEFVQDLMFHCIPLDIQFRAILTYDTFHYQRRLNCESYYGSALINSYLKEKKIAAMGLFIDKKIIGRNKVFATFEFDNDFYFVFITQNLIRLMEITDGVTPVDFGLLDSMVNLKDLKREIALLSLLKKNIHTQKDSTIRSKYIQTYELFRRKIEPLLNQLERNNFDASIVNPDIDWTEFE